MKKNKEGSEEVKEETGRKEGKREGEGEKSSTDSSLFCLSFSEIIPSSGLFCLHSWKF